MKTVIITSENPVKIQAVKNAFAKMFPNEEFEFNYIPVPSDIPEQPFNLEETFNGAKNRTDNASKKIPNAAFYVGIEGGLEKFQNQIGVVTWAVIKSGNKYGKAKSETFFLPEKITELLNQGKELKEAMKILFNEEEINKKSGTIGFLTKDIINRTTYSENTVILALIPFKNKELY